MQEPTKEGSASSLPDQIPLIAIASSSQFTDEQELPKHRPVKPPKKYSKKLKAVLKPRKTAKPKYFTSAYGVDDENAIDVSKDPCPFIYPSDLEAFAHKIRQKAWRHDVRVEDLKKKCSEKLGGEHKLKSDLLRRLYVKEPQIEKMKTVLDVDSEYFSMVEGRPIPDKVDIRSYIEMVRETLRTRILIGYREDDIMLIEENLLLEQQMIDVIKENYQTYVNTFEEFLYRDHTSAMKLLKDADISTTASYDKYAELRALEKKYLALRSMLYNSEDKWRNCKIFQKFLYVVSPMSWKEEKGITLAESDEGEDIFQRDNELSDEASLTDMLKMFKKEVEEEKTPELYFTEPEQIMDVFRFMEMQNLNSLLHSEELAKPLENIKEGMEVAAVKFDEEIKVLKDAAARIAEGISWEEARVKYLEDLAVKLIETEFKTIVMNDEVLNLHVFVEDVYETRVGPNDANLSMLEMMRGIEEKYRNELLNMDKVPAEQVALLEGSCYAEQVRIMRLAEKAARQHAEMERLIYRLHKAFAPPFHKPMAKDPKKRSALVEAVAEPPPPPRSLTDKEEEYLEFFTDFCKYTDDLKDYGVNVDGGKSDSKSTKKEEHSPGKIPINLV